MIVTTLEHVTTELLEMLYPAHATHASAPGLLFAPTADRLMARAEAMATRLTAGETSGAVVELLPLASIEQIAVGERLVLGAGADAATIGRALSRPLAALSLLTHSNGFDLYLGGGLSMCDAVTDDGRTIDGAPCCRLTGTCFRQHAPIAEAVASGTIVPANTLRARILVLYSCLGILGSRESRHWGYINGMLDGEVTAIVTSWSVIVPGSADLERLLGYLYRGVPIGQIVATINHAHGDARLALVGDPDARIDPLSTEVVKRVKYCEVRRVIPEHSQHFLLALTAAAALDGNEETRYLAQVAAEHIRHFARDVGFEQPTPRDSDVALRMRIAVMAFVSSVGPLISHHWLPLTTSRRRHGTQPCDECGAPAGRLVFEFAVDAMPARELLICPRCGIRRDAVAGSQLRVTREGRLLKLSGDLPHRQWSAIISLVCQDKDRSAVWRWPSSDSGAPAPTFAPPSPWPPGPLSVSVALLARADLQVVITPAPGG